MVCSGSFPPRPALFPFLSPGCPLSEEKALYLRRRRLFGSDPCSFSHSLCPRNLGVLVSICHVSCSRFLLSSHCFEDPSEIGSTRLSILLNGLMILAGNLFSSRLLACLGLHTGSEEHFPLPGGSLQLGEAAGGSELPGEGRPWHSPHATALGQLCVTQVVSQPRLMSEPRVRRRLPCLQTGIL